MSNAVSRPENHRRDTPWRARQKSLTFPLGYANICFAMPTHRAGIAYAEVLESADRHV